MPAPLIPDFDRRDWTVEGLRALPDDGNRYEVIDGELFVTPAPSLMHQRAVNRLSALVTPYADSCSLECILAPADVSFSPRRSVQPDLFVLPLMDGRPAQRFEDVGRLLLAIEVLSPSTIRADRYRKRALYRSESIPDYWIVDPAGRYVERWRPGDDEPEILVERLVWQPVAGREPLVVDLREYFSTVHGE